jgi:hypothetical protein
LADSKSYHGEANLGKTGQENKRLARLGLGIFPAKNSQAAQGSGFTV